MPTKDWALYLPSLIRSDSGIWKPEDLAGRTIGDAVGGGGILLFRAFAELKQIKGYQFIPMAPTAKNPSLLAGKVDAIATMVHILPGLRKKARTIGKDIRPILFSEHGLDVYSHGFISRNTMLQGNPDLTRRFLKATLQAVAWAAESPDESMDIYQKLFPAQDRFSIAGSLDIQLNSLFSDFAKQNGIGWIDRAKMTRTRDLIVKYRKLSALISIDDLFTNEFLPRLFPKRSKISY